MTQPRLPAWSQCNGKEPFTSPGLANRIAKQRTRAKKRRGLLTRPLHAYRCDHCGFYHLGGATKR